MIMHISSLSQYSGDHFYRAHVSLYYFSNFIPLNENQWINLFKITIKKLSSVPTFKFSKWYNFQFCLENETWFKKILETKLKSQNMTKYSCKI